MRHPCPNCGSGVVEDAQFCPSCGAGLPGGPVAAADTPPASGPPPIGPPEGDRWSPALIAGLVAAGVVGAVILVVILVAAFDGDDGGGSTPATPVASAATVPTTASTTTAPAPEPVAPAPAAPQLPADLSGGLFCRDLNARGFGYADAVEYWYAEGSPSRMDADDNGYPCETVYPRADVIAYWGFDPQG